MCEAVAAAQGHRAALACLSSRTRSTSGQRSAVGTLRKLVECESTRWQTIKDIVKAGYDDVVEVVRDPFNPAFDAKEDAVIVLAKCVAHGYGDNAKKNGPDAVKLDVFKRSQALEYCVDHATDRRDDGANMNLREAASAVVREMSELDEVKDAISTREIIRGLVRVMWEEKETATLQCRANACATIFNVCTQSRRKYEEEMRAHEEKNNPAAAAARAMAGASLDDDDDDDDDDRGSDGGGGSDAGAPGERAKAGGAGEDPGADAAAAAASPLKTIAAPAKLDALALPTMNSRAESSVLTHNLGESLNVSVAMMVTPSEEEMRRMEMVIDEGGIHPLVMLCAGAAGLPEGFVREEPPEDPVPEEAEPTPEKPKKKKKKLADDGDGLVEEEEEDDEEQGSGDDDDDGDGDGGEGSGGEGEGGDDGEGGGDDDGEGGDDDGEGGDDAGETEDAGATEAEAEDDAGGGKKKKKGKKKGGKKKGGKKGGKKKKAAPKKPTLTPAMIEARSFAAGVLRRMTTRGDWAARIASSHGALTLLLPLLETKDSQTRWHAQAALWNISGDTANVEALAQHDAPSYLTKIGLKKLGKENQRPGGGEGSEDGEGSEGGGGGGEEADADAAEA